MQTIGVVTVVSDERALSKLFGSISDFKLNIYFMYLILYTCFNKMLCKIFLTVKVNYEIIVS